MKKFSPSHLTLAALAALSFGSTAQAQDSGAWYLSPSVVRLYPDSDWTPDNNTNGLGLKVGRVLAPHWDLQFGASTARSRSGSSSYRHTLLGADVLYLFGEPGIGFHPFVSAGLGAERDSLKGVINASKYSPFVSAGLGARYQFTNALGLQADWKRVHGMPSSGARTALGLGNDNKSNNGYLGLALNYTFGAGETMAAPRPAVAPPPPMAVAAAPAAAPAPAPAPAAAPAPAPAAKPAAAPAPRMERITMQGTELFALNKAELRSPQAKLDELAATLIQNPSIGRVVVSGHTDRLGSDKLNKPLSQRRADAVKRYLVDKGVAADRIQAVGKGSTLPVKTCTDKSRAKLVQCLEPNRRVEVEPVTFERPVK